MFWWRAAVLWISNWGLWYPLMIFFRQFPSSADHWRRRWRLYSWYIRPSVSTWSRICNHLGSMIYAWWSCEMIVWWALALVIVVPNTENSLWPAKRVTYDTSGLNLMTRGWAQLSTTGTRLPSSQKHMVGHVEILKHPHNPQKTITARPTRWRPIHQSAWKHQQRLPFCPTVQRVHFKTSWVWLGILSLGTGRRCLQAMSARAMSIGACSGHGDNGELLRLDFWSALPVIMCRSHRAVTLSTSSLSVF